MLQQADQRSQEKGWIVPIFVTTLMGGLWLFLASTGLSGSVQSVLSVLIALLMLGLVIASIRFTAQVRKIATGPSPFADRRKRLIYIGAIVFEVLAYFMGRAMLIALQRLDLSLALLAFVVGLHFFGLIPVFQTRRYIPIATLFCLVAIIAAFLPEQLLMSGFLLNVRTFAIGLVCGLCLWYSAIGLLLRGERFIRGM